MMDRSKVEFIGLVGAVLVAVAFLPAPTAAQQEVSGRFRVMVPDLFPMEDANRGFGEDVAEELRDLINELATHQPVERREIRDALRQFDVDRDDLNCIRARQLAAQIDAQLVMCGSYTEGADDWSVTAEFVSVANGETFGVPDVVVPDDDGDKAAALHILQAFETFVAQTRFDAFCQEYFVSQQWTNALTNCDQAIDLNPSAATARYTRARTYMELERSEDALEEFKQVLELNPIHENALQYAGYVSAQLGRDDDARGYYSDYLELNPANAAVRMRVAYDLATAGDPAGAMGLIDEGIAMDAENVDLWEQLGGFAFTAAGQAMEESGSDELTPEVGALYQRAIEAYGHVFDAKGVETTPAQISNIIAANIQLGQLPEAISFAERAIEVHPNEAGLWSRYADALQRNGQISEAIEALDGAKRADPDYPNLAARQGSWLLGEGRIDEAITYLQEAVVRGEQPADMMANMVFGKAYNDGVQQKNYSHAIDILQKAKVFEVSDKMASQLDFWHGYSLYNRGLTIQEPQTVQSARTSLPLFQQALQLFETGRAYAATADGITLQQFLDAAGTYIEIQDAIIKRGG